MVRLVLALDVRPASPLRLETRRSDRFFGFCVTDVVLVKFQHVSVLNPKSIDPGVSVWLRLRCSLLDREMFGSGESP